MSGLEIFVALLALYTAVASLLFAGVLLVPRLRRKPGSLPPYYTAADGHVHEYDHMYGDGLWRCRFCEEPKPRGT